MNIHSVPSPRVGETLLQHLVPYLVEHLKAKHNLYLYLSGGSSISLNTDLAKLLVRADVPLNTLQVAQVDERYDQDPNHPDSNQRMIKEDTQIMQLLEPKGVKFRWMLNGESVEDESRSYERFLDRAFASQNTINVGIFGMGEDGHIGGIKPDPDEKAFRERFLGNTLTVYYKSEDFPMRLTITLRAIEQFDYLVFFIKGDAKKKALQMAQKADTKVNQYPVSFIRNLNKVDIFTDIKLKS